MSGTHRPAFDRYLQTHPAGHAGTVRVANTIAAPTNGAHRHQVAEYARHHGEPFRVLHDLLVHPPYGLYRVYLAGRQIGKQLSFPSADDCHAMERPMRYGEPDAHPPAERTTEPKRCAMCRKMLPLSSFGQLVDGRRHSYCKPCRSERETARYRRARDGAADRA